MKEFYEKSQTSPNEEVENSGHYCRNCGSYDVEEGYKLELCHECRNKLAKRPVPIKIKLFFILIIIMFLASLIKLPKTLNVAVEYQRGEKAEKNLKYITAMKHFEKVSKEFPNFDKGLAKLYKAYYMNGEITKARKTHDKLMGADSTKKVDKDLATYVNNVTDDIETYYEFSEDLYTKLKNLKSSDPSVIVKTLEPLSNKHDEPYGRYYLADLYFDLNKYNEGIKVLESLKDDYPDYLLAYTLEASFYREVGKYDDAISDCNFVLSKNKESIGAYISLAKIELKRKHNKDGLMYAKKAYDLESGNSGSIAVLSLAYFYNGKSKESKEMFDKFKKIDPTDDYSIKFLSSIFNGTLKWQR